MKKKKNKKGILYIVPTPIGNLKDITKRAIIVLKKVNLILAENKKHTNILLNNLNIKKKIYSLNKFNEKKKSLKFIKILKKKIKIAIVSNAGTPIINDPGYILIKLCYLNNIKIVPLPGPCAAITALIGSGISANKFCYEGFLPKKIKEKKKRILSFKKEERTIIVNESPHRIISSMREIKNILGSEKIITLTKELTKKWELIKKDTTYNILKWLKKKKKNTKGEITIIIKGCKKKKKKEKLKKKILKTFKIVNLYVKYNTAIRIISKIYNIKKNFLYKKILNTIKKICYNNKKEVDQNSRFNKIKRKVRAPKSKVLDNI